MGKAVADKLTVEADPTQTSVTDVAKPVTSGFGVTVIASVFPLEVTVVQPFKVILLIVTLVVPELLKVGVLNVPAFPELTTIEVFVAAAALSPVKV